MINTTRRNFLTAGLIAAAALSFGGLDCLHGMSSSDNASLEKRVEKQETGKKQVVLNSKFVPTNFGFYGDKVCYTVSRSHGSYFAYEDGKVFSAEVDSETIHYAEPEKNKSRVIFDVKEPWESEPSKPIQYIFPSSAGVYLIAGKEAMVYTPSKGLEKKLEGKREIPVDMAFDYSETKTKGKTGGEYQFDFKNASREVKERDRLRIELNRKLGENIGINYASQIRVNDKREVQVVYRQIEGKNPAEASYKLVVETLDKDRIGEGLYNGIVRAYSEKRE